MINHVFNNRVVVKPRDVEEKTSTGIYVPSAKGKKQQIGEVVAVGTGMVLDDGTRVPPESKVGDIVVFEQYAGTKIVDEGQLLIVLKETDLLVKLSGD